MKATIYHNPMCGTSRKTLEILNNEGADDTVAFVQQSQHRDALRHRSDPSDVASAARNVGGDRLIALDFILTIAGRSRDKQRQRQEGPDSPHAWSGFHAS